MTEAEVFVRMRADHRRVLDEIGDLERAAGGTQPDLDAIRAFVALLERQFATHMASEDEVLFPALAAALPATAASLAPLQQEHHELRGMLAALAALLDAPAGAERDEQVAVQVADIAELLRIHIRKEEALVFRVAERVLRPGELERLADRRSARVPSPAHPSDANSERKGNPR